jgi:hypothetical protein
MSIPMPGLNRELIAKEYRVDVGDRFCTHSAPTRDGAVNAALWIWRADLEATDENTAVERMGVAVLNEDRTIGEAVQRP